MSLDLTLYVPRTPKDLRSYLAIIDADGLTSELERFRHFALIYGTLADIRINGVFEDPYGTLFRYVSAMQAKIFLSNMSNYTTKAAGAYCAYFKDNYPIILYWH